MKVQSVTRHRVADATITLTYDELLLIKMALGSQTTGYELYKDFSRLIESEVKYVAD